MSSECYVSTSIFPPCYCNLLIPRLRTASSVQVVTECHQHCCSGNQSGNKCSALLVYCQEVNTRFYVPVRRVGEYPQAIIVDDPSTVFTCAHRAPLQLMPRREDMPSVHFLGNCSSLQAIPEMKSKNECAI